MRTLWDDPDDEWSRVNHELRVRQAAHRDEVMTGALSPQRYAELAGRYDEIDEVIKLIRQVKLGERIAPPRYERVPHVEE